MKRKPLMIGLGLLIAGTLLGTTALAGLAPSNGYEAFKAALISTHNARSVTIQAEASLRDNGNLLMTCSKNMKLNTENRTFSGGMQVTVGDITRTWETFSQNGQSITKAGESDIYQVTPHPERNRMKEQESRSLSGGKEQVMDILFANLQSSFTLENKADGGKIITFKLAGTKVPAPVKALAGTAIKRHFMMLESTEKNYSVMGDLREPLKNTTPKLVTNIKIDNIAMETAVDKANIITNQTGQLAISGKDAAGESHQITIDLTMSLTNLNETNPETVDLSGKKVETLGVKEKHRFGGHF